MLQFRHWGRRVISLGTMLASLALTPGFTGCSSSNSTKGISIPNPEAEGQQLIAVYHGTYSDTNKAKRLPIGQIANEGMVAELHYTTSGRKNARISVKSHAQYFRNYLARYNNAPLLLVGYSQGGCLALQILNILSDDSLGKSTEILDRITVILVAPAGEVKFGKSTAAAEHMVVRCSEAEATLADRANSGTETGLRVKNLLSERLWIFWGEDDVIVKTNSTDPQNLTPCNHVLYNNYKHLDWTKPFSNQDKTKCLASGLHSCDHAISAIVESISRGRDPKIITDSLKLGGECKEQAEGQDA